MAAYIKQLLLIAVVAFLYTKAATQPMSLPNCPSKCGSVTIPYPFGTTEECSLDNTFLIDCNNTSQIPFLPENKNISVLNISLDDGVMRVAWPIASDCYTKKGELGELVNQTPQDINMTNFHISPTRNKLIAVGCDTVGVVGVADSRGNNYLAGCMTYCNMHNDTTDNQSCSGVGCCEVSIPRGYMLREVNYVSGAIYNHSSVNDFNPCGYVFLAENGNYNFSRTDLKLQKKEFPVLLNWAVGNQTCDQAKNLTNYACKADKSTCHNSTERSGYFCKCPDGYQGNPYRSEGCHEGIMYYFHFKMSVV
ncbi:wall-associated receptor kinase 2-like protein [Trifolium pratense]|uniref:Wall-associated receptor kinase 2-like protein n=1 Tax=Trifolium pratense TaxID=57577 RepID=A0A2K3M0J5_TRIPR|nr:wall-associated receptor kinase 2-like protein [Trifolium pratense]